jgi:beta-lactamase class A
MISISDNTAADHLIRLLGRRPVERQLRRFGMEHPRDNQPFLTTRELFQLKLNAYPSLADAYQALDPPARRKYLRRAIDPLPLPATGPWDEPRAIDSIEWLGAPLDICRAFAGLRRQADDPRLVGVDHALSINDGGIGLDRHRWARVWFKGGSEPGVLTLDYLGTTDDGRTFVVSIMLSNPQSALDESLVATQALALANGAFALAADAASRKS